MKHVKKMRELYDWREDKYFDISGDRIGVNVGKGDINNMFHGYHE
jgi:hypothetical protein